MKSRKNIKSKKYNKTSKKTSKNIGGALAEGNNIKGDLQNLKEYIKSIKLYGLSEEKEKEKVKVKEKKLYEAFEKKKKDYMSHLKKIKKNYMSYPL